MNEKRTRALHALACLAAGIALAILYLTVGNMAYEDEKLDEQATCGMIAAGYWPESVGPWCPKGGHDIEHDGL